MLKEEVKDFAEIGESYTFITDAGNVEGEIQKYGESALIIRQKNGGRRMISYDHIFQIGDILPSQEVSATQPAQKAKVPLKAPENSSVNQNAINSLAPLSESQEASALQNSMPAARVSFRENEQVRVWVENGAEAFKKAFDVLPERKPAYNPKEISMGFRNCDPVPQGWSDVFNMFTNAVKSHALETKKQQIFQRMNQLIKKYPSCRQLYILMGHIYVQYNSFRDAATYFCMGGDYENETLCCISAGMEKRASYALADVIKKEYAEDRKPEDDDIIRLFWYAGAQKTGRAALDALGSHTADFSDRDFFREGLLYLVHCYHLENKVEGSDCPTEVLLYLMTKDAALVKEDPDDRERVREKKSAGSGETVLPARIPKKVVDNIEREGTILWFNPDKRYGRISPDVHFYIKQVEDYNLRVLLLNGEGEHRQVKYRFCRNQYEKKAADHIVPAVPVEAPGDLSTEHEVYKGFIGDYDRFGDRGFPGSGEVTRNSDSRPFTFSPQAITDPELKQRLKDTARPKEMDVWFEVRMDKPTAILRMAATKDYFANNKYRLSVNKVPDYEEMEPWYDSNEETAKDDTGIGISAARAPESPVAAQTAAREESKSSAFLQTPVLPVPDENPEVRRACNLLYHVQDKNPFRSMSSLPHSDSYFREGLKYFMGKKNDATGEIEGVNLEKAEQSFIRAICASDNQNSSVANLISIYTRRGEIVKGLQLLDVYGVDIESEKLLDLRIQLIDKSGNQEALITILRYSVKAQIGKPNKIFDRSLRLANAYFKGEKWQEAIMQLDENLEFMRKNRTVLRLDEERMKNRQISTYRMLSSCYVMLEDMEKAKENANAILKLKPDDDWARGIVNEDYTKLNWDITSLELTTNSDELTVEETEGSISSLAWYQMDKVDLNVQFGKMKKVTPKFQDNHYTGTNEDVQRDIKDINYRLQKNLALPLEDYSKDLFGLARMALDARRNSGNVDGNVSMSEIRGKYIGRAMSLLAEITVRTTGSLDVVRTYYSESLYYLTSAQQSYQVNSLNRLIYTFFISAEELIHEIDDIKNRNSKDFQINKYFDRPCSSYMNLIHTAIELPALPADQTYEMWIRKKIYCSDIQRDGVIRCAEKYLNQAFDIRGENDETAFDTMWTLVKDKYKEDMLNIRKELKGSVDDCEMPDRLRPHIRHLETLTETGMLYDLDREYLRRTIALLNRLNEAQQESSVDDKEEGYATAMEEFGQLRTRIYANPTKFGFETLCIDVLDPLEVISGNMLNQLYADTKPEISRISLASDSVFVQPNNIVQLTILFENEKFKQTASGVTITVQPEDGVKLDARIGSFNSIRSGHKEEFIAIFHVSPEILKQGQFELKVLIHYKYHERINESMQEEEREEKLNVNLSSRDSFKHIENRYVPLVRASSVSVPDMFKGRDKLIDRICKSLDLGGGNMLKRRGIVLWGQKRVGKNSVKDYLKTKIQETYPGVYIPIDLGSIGRSHTLKEILITLVTRTENALNAYPELKSRYHEHGLGNYRKFLFDAGEDTYMSVFDGYMTELCEVLKGDPNRNIPLYYMDEFTYLYELINEGSMDGTRFMRFWKSFLQDEYDICAILIGQDSIPVWSAQYPNEFSCMDYTNEITYLDYDGARDLICDPCRLNGESRFTTDAVDYIYSLTGGSAYLIVILCDAIINYLNDSYTEKVTKSIVDIVLKDGLIANKDKIFKKADFEPQLNDVTKVLDEAEAVKKGNEKLITQIAQNSKDRYAARIEEIPLLKEPGETGVQANVLFNRLKDRHVIVTDGNGYCSIRPLLLKFYMLRENEELSQDMLKWV